jgi:hypothetical protein
MTTTPADDQSRPGGPGQGGCRGPGERWESWCLTPAEIAELSRLDGDPDEDAECGDDPDCGPPPEWWALPEAERDRLMREAFDPPASRVAESIPAGFTHGTGGSGTGFEAGGICRMTR